MNSDLESRLLRYGDAFEAAVDRADEDRSLRDTTYEVRRPKARLIAVIAVSVIALSGLAVYLVSNGRSDHSPGVEAGAAPSPGTAQASDCAPNEASTVTMPDVIGKRLGPAIREVEAAGLNVVGFGVPTSDPTTTSSRISAQQPEGGALTPGGTCVQFRTTGLTHAVTLVALPSISYGGSQWFRFDRHEYVAWPGKVTVRLHGASGLTLAFDDPRFKACFLKTDGGPRSCHVTLRPGRYLVYDVVPGHRLTGLEATIVVPKPGS